MSGHSRSPARAVALIVAVTAVASARGLVVLITLPLVTGLVFHPPQAAGRSPRPVPLRPPT
jgi:hypothetical protein